MIKDLVDHDLVVEGKAVGGAGRRHVGPQPLPVMLVAAASQRVGDYPTVDQPALAGRIEKQPLAIGRIESQVVAVDPQQAAADNRLRGQHIVTAGRSGGRKHVSAKVDGRAAVVGDLDEKVSVVGAGDFVELNVFARNDIRHPRRAADLRAIGPILRVFAVGRDVGLGQTRPAAVGLDGPVTVVAIIENIHPPAVDVKQP